jgi:hypothetical protein
VKRRFVESVQANKYVEQVLSGMGLGFLIQDPGAAVVLIRLDLNADRLSRVSIRSQDVDSAGIPQGKRRDEAPPGEFSGDEVLASYATQGCGELRSFPMSPHTV